jgi:hypothetical protein
MGGFGSGERLFKANTVEGCCCTLDLRLFARKGAFRSGNWGNVEWTRAGEVSDSIGWSVKPLDLGGLCLWLDYQITRSNESVKLPIQLETTRPHFGGVRWWGRCPLVVNGHACARRVAKVYLPPGARYFGCRECYKLTYASAQTHDARVDALRRSPEQLAEILENLDAIPDSRLILALKAMRG